MFVCPLNTELYVGQRGMNISRSKLDLFEKLNTYVVKTYRISSVHFDIKYKTWCRQYETNVIRYNFVEQQQHYTFNCKVLKAFNAPLK
jgi:hypothetical protein